MMGIDISSLPLEEKAVIFVRPLEGFSAAAKWDVNAYRLGYGSDTITTADGFYRKAVSGDVTTMQNASVDLLRRIKTEFIPRVKNQVGSAAWNNLPQAAQIALVDLVYNYGSITHPTIILAARTNNMKILAKTLLDATAGENPELKSRRQKEADLILLASGSPGAAPGTDSWIMATLAAAAAALMLSKAA